MDLVHDRASMIAEEEDRISNLPDEIIHCILSFLDMKYAVQTCTLSKKWKHIWTSMPVLNLNSHTFPTLPRFAKFVKNALSHRNHCTEVSAVELTFTGVATQFSVKSIVKYAYSHNVRKMTMMWSRLNTKVLEFPQCIFSSHTLKHLTLATKQYGFHHIRQHVPKSAWCFPVLETLNLSNLQLGDGGDKSLNLFSKCVNLKNLTLHGCSMLGVDIFTVCAPLLFNLTITDPAYFPKVFNVVASQLENLITSVNSTMGFDFLQLSTARLDSLEKVNLSLSSPNYNTERFLTRLLNLFQKVRNAKFLILDKGIIEALSSCVDQLLHEPCPFNNLKCLKQKGCMKTMPTQLRNYLLESSPNATFIMDLPPQLPQKRSRQQVDQGIMAKKVAKMEEEKEILNLREKIRVLEAKAAERKAEMEALYAEHEANMEARKLQLEKMMSQMISCKIAEVQVQVVSGNPDYELIRSIKSIMELTPESLKVAMKAQFSCRYQEMKSLFLAHIDGSEWAKIEMELDVALPSPSSTNMATSSIIANAQSGTGSSADVQPS